MKMSDLECLIRENYRADDARAKAITLTKLDEMRLWFREMARAWISHNG